MNKQYRQALKKGLQTAHAANGAAFIKAYKEMTADIGHRAKQTVVIKGIFRKEAAAGE